MQLTCGHNVAGLAINAPVHVVARSVLGLHTQKRWVGRHAQPRSVVTQTKAPGGVSDKGKVLKSGPSILLRRKSTATTAAARRRKGPATRRRPRVPLPLGLSAGVSMTNPPGSQFVVALGPLSTRHCRRPVPSTPTKCALTLRAVSARMVFAPQFWTRVAGMISKALATARYGHCWTPVMLLPFSVRCCKARGNGRSVHLTVGAMRRAAFRVQTRADRANRARSTTVGVPTEFRRK